MDGHGWAAWLSAWMDRTQVEVQVHDLYLSFRTAAANSGWSLQLVQLKDEGWRADWESA